MSRSGKLEYFEQLVEYLQDADSANLRIVRGAGYSTGPQLTRPFLARRTIHLSRGGGIVP